MINILFITTNPAAAAATPEREFNRDMTTGISPPPMGRTNITPNTKETATTAKNTGRLSGVLIK
jgi:hypothetical protein